MNLNEKDGEKRNSRTLADGFSYSDVDSQMGEFARNVEVNERLLQRLQQYELMLLDAASLPAVLDVLLISTREHFQLSGSNLTLYDPQGVIAGLMSKDLDYGDDLILVKDSFDMQQMYGVQPKIEVIDVSDHRAVNAVASEEKLETLVLLPLLRDGNIVGSFHWGAAKPSAFRSAAELEFMVHLAAIIAICLENCINAERLSLLSLLDPVTRLSNFRAFGMELRKEISRSHRNEKPLTMFIMQVDDFRNINERYGHLSGDYTIKAIARKISNMLRSTDYLARTGLDQFGILLPACSVAKGQEIAERMRSEIEFMEIDDGRGANLFTSLAVGITSWSTHSYPAVNMEQLAGKMHDFAVQGMQRATEAGGNRIVLQRLHTTMV
ncbi:MAG: diguanylate cyclase [Gammaproteobacteria bacterium]|nr:diguanylate cyclase [Gammaproteobacteria bacterium]